MIGVEPPWEELHHRSYFLPELDHLVYEEFRDIISERIGSPVVPLISFVQMANGNMENLSPTIPINISRDLEKLRTSIVGRVVPLMRSWSIPSYLKSFVKYFLVHMRKCQVLTLVLSNMRLKLSECEAGLTSFVCDES